MEFEKNDKFHIQNLSATTNLLNLREIFKRLNSVYFPHKKGHTKDLVSLEQLIHKLRKRTFQLIKLGPLFNVIILVEPLIFDLSTNSQNTQQTYSPSKTPT